MLDSTATIARREAPLFANIARAEIVAISETVAALEVFFDQDDDGGELAVLVRARGPDRGAARFFLAPGKGAGVKLWEADQLASGAPSIFPTVALVLNEVRRRVATEH